MSILIKGIDIPEACNGCQFLEGDKDDGLCHAANRWLEGDIDTSKPVNCPLVHVPPHGRLIDADELRRGLCVECTLYPDKCLGDECDWNLIYHIDYAPTIIEAEGE